MSHKKTLALLAAAILCMFITVGTTLAYFTASVQEQNVLVLGNGIGISLTEPNWEQDSLMSFNASIAKDPTITAWDTNGTSCYVRLNMRIHENLLVVLQSLPQPTDPSKFVIKPVIENGQTKTDGDGYHYYEYIYLEPLLPGQSVICFEQVYIRNYQSPGMTNIELQDAHRKSIILSAHAIQASDDFISQGSTSAAEEAFKFFDQYYA